MTIWPTSNSPSDARKIKPDIRVVLRMYDQELASKIKEAFDIHLAFSQSELTAPIFATSSSDRTIVNSFYVGDRLLVVARFTIHDGSGLHGKAIRDVGIDRHVIILSVERGGETTLFPTGEVELKTGDLLTVQTEPSVLKELHEINRGKSP